MKLQSSTYHARYSLIAASIFVVVIVLAYTAGVGLQAQTPAVPAVPLAPLQNANLHLDSPALPDTVASEQPDWDYFAWNSFIALNWPALETTPKNYRGIPDTSKSFATAAHTDTGVWETFKEKREVFNHPANAGTLTWNSAVDYGSYRDAEGNTYTGTDDTNGRIFHQSSGVTTNAFDETVEVASESLEPKYPTGATNPVINKAVTPRVWRGEPSELNPIVYEVKVNYDFFDYVVTNKYNVDNSAAGNPVETAAEAAKIHLPYRTSSSMPAGGENKPTVGYRANTVKTTYQTINTLYKTKPNTPNPNTPPTGAVHIKAAWVKLAKDDPTMHTTMGQYYKSVKGTVEVSEPALFGLVGLHIIQRIHTTDASNPTSAQAVGGTFIFATWEHDSVYNSPAQGATNPAPKFFYSNFFPGPAPAPDFYPPLTNPYPVERMYPVLPNTIKVNTAVHAAIKAKNKDSVWQHYHLIGTQFQAINVTDTPAPNPPFTPSPNDPTGIGQPVFMSNLAIETNTGLQHFQGQPPGITVIGNYKNPPVSLNSNPGATFLRGNNNMSWQKQKTGFNMGGCMGCHGVAQSKGFSFSFVLLEGYTGAASDTQTHFDTPSAATPVPTTGVPGAGIVLPEGSPAGTNVRTTVSCEIPSALTGGGCSIATTAIPNNGWVLTTSAPDPPTGRVWLCIASCLIPTCGESYLNLTAICAP